MPCQQPLTGRSLQLRVHCAASFGPIRGDEIYGTATRDAGPGLHLHAQGIAIPLNPKREPVRIAAPPPACLFRHARLQLPLRDVRMKPSGLFCQHSRSPARNFPCSTAPNARQIVEGCRQPQMVVPG